jgi:hypothetical protein
MCHGWQASKAEPDLFFDERTACPFYVPERSSAELAEVRPTMIARLAPVIRWAGGRTGEARVPAPGPIYRSILRCLGINGQRLWQLIQSAIS